ncbi:hypothetical protein D3C76_1233070 [compost metagenome]
MALDLGPFRAAQAQLNRQLVAGLVAQVLMIEPTLQVGVVATVLAFHHPLGCLQGFFIDAGAGQQRQQQVQDLALIACRRLDDERGVGIAGEGIPLAPQGLHALFQAAFTALIDAAEQQVFEQMRQFLVGATEVVQAHADHQADRHMPALGAGLEQQLHAVGQHIAFDLEPVQGDHGQ